MTILWVVFSSRKIKIRHLLRILQVSCLTLMQCFRINLFLHKSHNLRSIRMTFSPLISTRCNSSLFSLCPHRKQHLQSSLSHRTSLASSTIKNNNLYNLKINNTISLTNLNNNSKVNLYNLNSNNPVIDKMTTTLFQKSSKMNITSLKLKLKMMNQIFYIMNQESSNKIERGLWHCSSLRTWSLPNLQRMDGSLPVGFGLRSKVLYHLKYHLM